MFLPTALSLQSQDASFLILCVCVVVCICICVSYAHVCVKYVPRGERRTLGVCLNICVKETVLLIPCMLCYYSCNVMEHYRRGETEKLTLTGTRWPGFLTC